MSRRILTHGPRRRWCRPWHRLCRCGIDVWPCPVERRLEMQRRYIEPAAVARLPTWAARPMYLPTVEPTADRPPRQRGEDRW